MFAGALGAETDRKRSALWTLSCTWLSGLALSRASSGTCPDRRWQKTEVLPYRSLNTCIGGLHTGECAESVWLRVFSSHPAWVQCQS